MHRLALCPPGSSLALGWKVCVWVQVASPGLTCYSLKSGSESTHPPHPAVEGEAAKVPGSRGMARPQYESTKTNCCIGPTPGQSIVMKSSNSGQLFDISDTKLLSLNNANSKIWKNWFDTYSTQIHEKFVDSTLTLPTPKYTNNSKNYEIRGPIAILQTQGKCSIAASIFLAYGHGAWLDLIGIIKDTWPQTSNYLHTIYTTAFIVCTIDVCLFSDARMY